MDTESPLRGYREDTYVRDDRPGMVGEMSIVARTRLAFWPPSESGFSGPLSAMPSGTEFYAQVQILGTNNHGQTKPVAVLRVRIPATDLRAAFLKMDDTAWLEKELASEHQKWTDKQRAAAIAEGVRSSRLAPLPYSRDGGAA